MTLKGWGVKVMMTTKGDMVGTGGEQDSLMSLNV